MIRPDLITARFSIQEAVQHLLLLEDHCAVPDRRCGDCVRKHLWMARAFLSEAHGLRCSAEDLALLLEAELALSRAWRLLLAGCDKGAVAQVLRTHRKRILPNLGAPPLLEAS